MHQLKLVTKTNIKTIAVFFCTQYINDIFFACSIIMSYRCPYMSHWGMQLPLGPHPRHCLVDTRTNPCPSYRQGRSLVCRQDTLRYDCHCNSTHCGSWNTTGTWYCLERPQHHRKTEFSDLLELCDLMEHVICKQHL